MEKWTGTPLPEETLPGVPSIMEEWTGTDGGAEGDSP
jgi:hypothetical protein